MIGIKSVDYVKLVGSRDPNVYQSDVTVRDTWLLKN